MNISLFIVKISLIILFIVPLSLAFKFLCGRFKIKMAHIKDKIIEKKLDKLVNKKCKNIILTLQNIEPILKRFYKENSVKNNDYYQYFVKGKYFSDSSTFFRYITSGIISNNIPLNKVFFNMFIDDYDGLISDLFEVHGHDRNTVPIRICYANGMAYRTNITTLRNAIETLCNRKNNKDIKNYSFMDDIFVLCYYSGLYYLPWHMPGINTVRSDFYVILDYVFYKYCNYFNFRKPSYSNLNIKILNKLNKL